MKPRTYRNRSPRAPKRILALVGCAALAAADTPAAARDIVCDSTTSFPCNIQFDAVKLEKVGPVLKMQASVAQAKIPIGEGLFTVVHGKLVRGTETLCTEEFRNVRVVDGVVNLELGRNMDCELDEVIAANSDLAFQLCPGNADNCLPSIALGASPYAIKTSYAAVAGNAHETNLAAQAHYAHRFSADSEALAAGRVGHGYFDFMRPWLAQASELYPDAAAFLPWQSGGFLQWTPVRDRAALSLAFASRDANTGRVGRLTDVYLEAVHTLFAGTLTVEPGADGQGLVVEGRGAHVTGHSEIEGRLETTGAVTVASGGTSITGNSGIAGVLVTTDRFTVRNDGIGIVGNSRITGELTVGDTLRVLDGGARVVGNSSVLGTLDVSGTDASLEINGSAGVDGLLTIRDGLTVMAGGARVAAGGLSVNDGGVHIGGDVDVTGAFTAEEIAVAGSISALDGTTPRPFFAAATDSLRFNPGVAVSSTLIRGPVRFLDPVTFESDVTDPRQAQTFVLATGESRPLFFDSDLEVLGSASFPGGIVGGLLVAGNLSVTGPVSVSGGVAGGLDVGGNLTVTTGSTTIAEPVTLGGGISGGLAVSGDLSLGGPFSAVGNLNGGSVAANAGLSVGGGLTVAGATNIFGTTTLSGGVASAATFGADVTIAGAVIANGGAAVAGGLRVGGATRFNQPVTMPNVSGNTSFANSITVAGAANLAGSVAATSDLTIAGSTTFIGGANFSGTFNGTTNFVNVAASGALTVGGVSTLAGTVNFNNASVTGLDNLSAYVKAIGETRSVRIPNLTSAGAMALQGTLVAGYWDAPTARNLRVSGTISVANNVSANLTRVRGALNAAWCRLCIDLADFNDPNQRPLHMCTALVSGSSSGVFRPLGNVDSQNIVRLRYRCDGAGSSAGGGHP